MGHGAAVGVVTMILCLLISRALVGRFAQAAH
jgi:multiple sugar transport system permease protein